MLAGGGTPREMGDSAIINQGGSGMTPSELEAAVAGLDRARKADLLKRLADELVGEWPGIESDPAVAGGAPCIVRTRIPVWVLESYRRQGWTEARILANYPTLRAADLVQAWAYVAAHREAISAAIEENEAA
jgi:uncharacterized protein (DUF433 family)